MNVCYHKRRHAARVGLVAIVSALLLSACSSTRSVRDQPVVVEQRAVTVPEPAKRVEQTPDQPSPATSATSRVGSQNNRVPIVVDTPTGDVEVEPELTNPQTRAVAAAKSRSRPPVVALLDEADNNQAAGELELAAQKLERALRIDPRDPLPWHALARIRLQQQNYSQAINMASRSNVLLPRGNPLKQDNLRVIAQAYDALGNAEKAQQTRDQLTQ